MTALGTGGAERQLELLVAGSRHDNHTIALYDGGPVADSMRRAGHDVAVLDMTGWRKLTAPFLLARRLRRLHPQVAHVHLLAGQLWGIPAARLAGVPVVVSTEHSLMDDSIEGRALSRPLHLLYRVLERMVTRTVAVSSTTSDRLVRWGVDRDRIVVSDNGIDFVRLRFDDLGRRRLRTELGISPEATVIGAVGRLDPVKRIDVLLRASAPRLRAGAHLVVAGSGPLGPQLEALAVELGVAEAVHWVGSRGDVADLLSAFDVLVSASADETFGMAVIEGLAAGLPVAYVECPALEELPRHPAHAHRVGPDVEALAAGIEAALADARTTARHPVPSDLTERYSAASAACRNDLLYTELVQARRG